MTEKERTEIENEIMEQSRTIVFGERGKRAVNPIHKSARIVTRQFSKTENI
jgi:hypothetical protein